MQHARSEAMTSLSMLSHTVADPDVAAGHFLQHESEVFGAHGGHDVVVYLFRTNDFTHDFYAKCGLSGMIDGGWINPSK